MPRLMIIAASVTLLLGAADPARGNFIEDLRESVELSDTERGDKAAPERPAKRAGRKPNLREKSPAPGAGGKRIPMRVPGAPAKSGAGVAGGARRRNRRRHAAEPPRT